MNTSLLIQESFSLQEAQETILNEIRRATVDRKHPFRNVVLATVNAENEPVQRTVVLREMEKNDRFLIYTDQRSRKVRDLNQQTFCSMLMYHPAKKTQVTIKGKGKLVRDPQFLKEKWKHIGAFGAYSYTSNLSPGTPIPRPEQAHAFSPQDATNFCVIEIIAQEIEVLQLDGKTHRRFLLTKTDSGFKANWIAP